MVRGPHGHGMLAGRVCGTVLELYGRCTMAGGLVRGVGATPTVQYNKGGGGERGIAHWGQRGGELVRQYVFPFYISWLIVVSWWEVSDVGVATTVTNVRGWRRRHLVLGHVALALARVSSVG